MIEQFGQKRHKRCSTICTRRTGKRGMDEGVVKTHDDKIGGERKRILEGETGVTGYKKKRKCTADHYYY